MIDIKINGKSQSFESAITISHLLRQLEINLSVAIAINENIIPKSEFETHTLTHGDQVEIIRAVGGG